MEDIPHMAGMITNLQDDLTLVDRMRDALFGEMQRRRCVSGLLGKQDYATRVADAECLALLGQGGRQAYAVSSPVFRDYALRMTRTMAERYGTHPALALWHVDNELGCHVPRPSTGFAAACFLLLKTTANVATARRQLGRRQRPAPRPRDSSAGADGPCADEPQ